MPDDKKTDRDKLDALILLFLGALVAEVEGWLEKPKGGFPDALMPVIAVYHAQAGVLGRQAAGDASKPDKADEEFGGIQAESDAPYLEKFAGQLADGWGEEESGALNGKALRARLQLYAERLHATAHEAFVLASPESSLFYWRVASDNPCDDCLALDSGSPYTAETLPTVPGAGETQCKTACKCWLVRDDGLAPFAGE